MTTNSEVSAIFDEIADILELKDENRFQIRAYRRAARTIEGVTQDLVIISEKEGLKDLPGIGEAIAKKIDEILETGRLRYHDELRSSIPPGLLEMLGIQGLGPKTISKIHQELGIEDIEDLKRAAENHELRVLSGLGPKKEENILKGIEQYRRHSERTLLGRALPYAESIVRNLKNVESVKKVAFAGSLRRMRETIGDIDILVASKDSGTVMDAFTGLDGVSEVIACGNTKSSVILKGIQVDLRVVNPESFGAAMQYFTGSKQHNVRLREIAARKGFKINEYGVYRGEEKIAGETEEGVYESVGLSYIEPEMREDRGEIEGAMAGHLPELIEMNDIRGDLHIHTDWSDGRRSIQQMVKAAKSRGYEYMVVSDHSPAVGIAGGPSEEELIEQIEEVRSVNKDLDGFRVLTSTEVDIKSDNTLDYSDEILSELDIVIAAVHSKFSMDRDSMTDRIISAIENPCVDIIAHPTGRLLGQRDPYAVDMDRVIMAAKNNTCVLELNSNPRRLDLNDIHCRRAREIGVKIAISTDSHDIPQLHLMRYGVATARRGWLEKRDVVNTLSLDDILEFFDINE